MKQARRDVCLLRNHSFPSQNNDLFWTEGEQSDIHTISCNLCSQNHVKNKKLLSSENPHLAASGNLGFPALLSEISISCSSFYPESFITPGKRGLEHKVSCTLKYREHPGWVVCVCVCARACGWCAQGGIGKNKTWRQGCVCLHPNLIRQNCLQPCPERLRAAFGDCGLIFRHLISVSKCMSLSVGLGRITPLLIIFAVGFPLMFLMCPLALWHKEQLM